MNLGYQQDDEKIVDYQLWRLPGIALDLRGPKHSTMPEKYFVTLGAAQTFGRFVEKPFTELLQDHLGLPGINLGVSGAGPSFFLRNPELMQVINRAEFVIVQVMSGRSVDNSYFELGNNQGILRRRGTDGAFEFAEFGYKRFLQEEPEEARIALRAEVRQRYVKEMSALLNNIKPPTTLLWFSVRSQDYVEGTKDIGSYWGSFPHFVNRETIDCLRSCSDHFAEVVSDRGLPQALFDQQTGEPVLMWEESKFPDIRLRYHNLYYPSPEMHEDVAENLKEMGDALFQRGLKQKAYARQVVVHPHMHMNAGATVDSALRRYFGDKWTVWAGSSDQQITRTEDLVGYLDANPDCLAISSHKLRPPFCGSSTMDFLPLVWVRHPVERALFLYNYERTPGRRQASSTLHTQRATELSFRDFIVWALSSEIVSRPLSNYQTLVLSRAQTIRHPSRWDFSVTQADLAEVLDYLHTIPCIGLVNAFERSAAAFERWLQPVFPGISFSASGKADFSLTGADDLEARLQEIEASLGRDVYERLLQANELDLVLFNYARERVLNNATP